MTLRSRVLLLCVFYREIQHLFCGHSENKWQSKTSEPRSPHVGCKWRHECKMYTLRTGRECSLGNIFEGFTTVISFKCTATRWQHFQVLYCLRWKTNNCIVDWFSMSDLLIFNYPKYNYFICEQHFQWCDIIVTVQILDC